MDRALEQRFLAKVQLGTDDECWEWLGAKTAANGYGLISVDNKLNVAHRVSYELYNGEIPDGLWVLHKCDNRSCVNPKHLFIGTRSDNVQDMIAKGRNNPLSGSDHGNSRLSESDVREIRELYSAGKMSQRNLASRFKVSQTCIGLIVRGETWRDT